jgi:hypothetical protein
VGDRSGCAPVDLAVLGALDAATAGRPRSYVRSARALAGIEERIGLGPRYAYEVLLDLARPWVIPVRAVVAMGNIGDRSFPAAAGPGYTACRPSYAGQLALDAEAGQLAPVPLGLINGTTYRGGTQPALEPFRALAALRRVLDDPGVPDAEVISLAGPPYSVTGCVITGNIAALMRGRRVTLRETGRITVTGVPVPEAPAAPPPRAPGGMLVAFGGVGSVPSRPAHLVIESLPLGGMTTDVVHAIVNRAASRPRAEPHPGLPATLPVADVDEQSGRDGKVRILVTLRPGSDPEAVRHQLAEIHGVSAESYYQFPAPLAFLLRSWVERHRREDLRASLAALEDASRRDRQRERRNR